VLALQEVQPEQMDVLVRQLSDDYPHHLLAPAHPYGTTAIFSRLPFQEARIVDLQADRPAVLVQVEYQSRSVIVVSAHLLSYGLVWVPWSDIPRVSGQRIAEQNRQARNLIAVTQAGPNTSVIVACDCNSPETGGTARILYQAFQSSSHTAGWNTVPLTRPGTQLDLSPNHIEYLFFRGPLRPIAHYHLLDSGGSDHYPFVAEFVISSQ
jgi:endonuclease/exonuclease/phosphatase (EEP) superfamily protein YafD